MINVLHIGLDSEYGGIESCLYNLLRSIDGEQAFFTFIGYRDRSAYERKLEHFGLATIEAQAAGVFVVASEKMVEDFSSDGGRL